MRDMTEFEINDRHRKVRGSDVLKYPANEDRCTSTCGHLHDQVRDKMREHRCFLAMGHREKFCEFSSVCGETRVAPRGDIVGGVAA